MLEDYMLPAIGDAIICWTKSACNPREDLYLRELAIDNLKRLIPKVERTIHAHAQVHPPRR